MNLLQRILVDIQRALTDLEVVHALVGGLAVSVRVEPRFTRDIDLAVSVANDSEAERVTRDLLARGYGVAGTVEQDATGRLATVRLLPPDQDIEGIAVDLLFASSSIEPVIASAAEDLEVFPGTVVPVATTGHLIALKLLSRCTDRPQDDVARMVPGSANSKPRGSVNARDCSRDGRTTTSRTRPYGGAAVPAAISCLSGCVNASWKGQSRHPNLG